MAGLLSNIFDAGADDGASGSSQTYDAGVEQVVEFSPEVTIATEMGGSYQNLDGSTSTWSSSSDVTVTADVAVSTAANAIATFDQADEF